MCLHSSLMIHNINLYFDSDFVSSVVVVAPFKLAHIVAAELDPLYVSAYMPVGVAMNEIFDDWWAISLDEELMKTYASKLYCLTDLESDSFAAMANEEMQSGRKRKKEAESWLTNVTTKKSVFSQITNEFKEKGSSRNLKRSIEEETKEVEELLQEGDFPKGVALGDHVSKGLPSVDTKLVGQKCADNIKTISILLKEDGVFVIGVQSMGEFGQTALLKEIDSVPLSDSDIVRQVYWVTAVTMSCCMRGNMKALKEANLFHTGIERVPESVSDSETLRGLSLCCCKMLRDVLARVEFGDDGSNWLLPNTTEVMRRNESDTKGGSLGDVIIPSLRKGKAKYMKNIRIEECRGMISITKVVALGSFSYLECLMISGCPNMNVALPLTKKPPYLPYLKWIWVSECKEVEEIFGSNDEATQSQSNNSILSLPNLELIFLRDLPKLHRVYKGLLLGSSLLFELGIDNCPELELLPLPEGMIGDDSTMDSICGNTKFWETLYKDFPLYFHRLSDFFNQSASFPLY